MFRIDGDSNLVTNMGERGKTYTNMVCIKTLRSRRNGHFADDIFKCIFLNENVWISIQIWLKFVPKGSVDNKPALVQVMAWRRSGDKPLPEAMLTQFTDAYMWHQGEMS